MSGRKSAVRLIVVAALLAVVGSIAYVFVGMASPADRAVDRRYAELTEIAGDVLDCPRTEAVSVDPSTAWEAVEPQRLLSISCDAEDSLGPGIDVSTFASRAETLAAMEAPREASSGAPRCATATEIFLLNLSPDGGGSPGAVALEQRKNRRFCKAAGASKPN